MGRSPGWGVVTDEMQEPGQREETEGRTGLCILGS